MAITIKELHRTTGEYVRRAGSLKTPIVITDHGKPVAVLANPALLRPQRRKRILLPEYEALMAKPPTDSIQEALDAVRGDR